MMFVFSSPLQHVFSHLQIRQIYQFRWAHGRAEWPVHIDNDWVFTSIIHLKLQLEWRELDKDRVTIISLWYMHSARCFHWLKDGVWYKSDPIKGFVWLWSQRRALEHHRIHYCPSGLLFSLEDMLKHFPLKGEWTNSCVALWGHAVVLLRSVKRND